jgi:hypothetical protein
MKLGAALHARVADRFAREIPEILECDPIRSPRLIGNPFLFQLPEMLCNAWGLNYLNFGMAEYVS